MPAVELQIPPDTRHVSLARLVVVWAARRAGMDEDRLEDLRIAVSEATANAILAHQREHSSAPVVLSFGPDAEYGFQVVIADSGAGFDPDPPGALAERDWAQEGGLGVTLIRGLVDEVEFIRDAGMRVNLRFAIALSGAA